MTTRMQQFSALAALLILLFLVVPSLFHREAISTQESPTISAQKTEDARVDAYFQRIDLLILQHGLLSHPTPAACLTAQALTLEALRKGDQQSRERILDYLENLGLLKEETSTPTPGRCLLRTS